MSAQPDIRFGTDGWRAIVAEDYTFDNVRVCAAAVAMDLKSTGQAQRGVAVGYDTRFQSEQFAQTAAETIARSGRSGPDLGSLASDASVELRRDHDGCRMRCHDHRKSQPT